MANQNKGSKESTQQKSGTQNTGRQGQSSSQQKGGSQGQSSSQQRGGTQGGTREGREEERNR